MLESKLYPSFKLYSSLLQPSYQANPRGKRNYRYQSWAE